MNATTKLAHVAVAWLAPSQAVDAGDVRPPAALGAAAFVRSSAQTAPAPNLCAGEQLLKMRVLPRTRSVTDAPAWEAVQNKLTGFRSLDDDWDGGGAAAPSPGVVDGAASLAFQLAAYPIAPPDHMHVGVNGTVYLEWFTPHGHTEIEVTSPVEAQARWLPADDEDVLIVQLTRGM